MYRGLVSRTLDPGPFWKNAQREVDNSELTIKA